MRAVVRVQEAEFARNSAHVGRSIPYSAAPSYDYIPGLDGLRAASIVLVILSHIGFKHVLPGGFGVTAFFFVSGFLITRQVLAEQAAKGQISLGAFYARRLLRLYPALLVMLAIGGTIFVLLGGRFPLGQIAAGVLYFTNYYTRYSSYVGVPDGMYNPFAILWSLAVEEHYYLIYPGLVFLIGRIRPRFLLTLLGLIIAVTVWRFHLANECSAMVPRCIGDGVDDRILQGTDTRVDSILYGALLATLLGTRFGAPLLKLLQRRAVFAAGLLLLGASFVIRDPYFRDTGRFTLQGIGLSLSVGSVLFSEKLAWARALLTWRGAIIIGRWSYSLYLWHSIVVLCVVSTLPAAVWHAAIVDGRFSLLWYLVVVPVIVALSLAVAGLSYTFVEMPMVALRRRFGSHATREGTPAIPKPLGSELAEQ